MLEIIKNKILRKIRKVNDIVVWHLFRKKFFIKFFLCLKSIRNFVLILFIFYYTKINVLKKN
jgi:hypothetical protein